MNAMQNKRNFPLKMIPAALALSILACACQRELPPAASTMDAPAPAPLALVLALHAGDGAIDRDIRRCQEQIRHQSHPEATLERLGWLFVAKARESFDPGFYKLAEQSAAAIERRDPRSSDALLLRGHALHAMHRFHEAEPMARELASRRGLALDYGLLGDVLADLGRVGEAADAYQQMIDLKPDPPGYARAAHIRWLRGDLAGALELYRMAARGASAHDPESAAWLHVRLALCLWQGDELAEAGRAIEIALRFQPTYAPALLLRGRMLLSAAKTEEAIVPLREAARLNPLPDYHWVLAEALRAVHRTEEAEKVTQLLTVSGAGADPRTFALYLATRQERPELAVRLARRELQDRSDVLTHDALAWALSAAGQHAEARREIALALAEGTKDARLFFHAAAIAARAGQAQEALDWASRAAPFQSLLLPSEREQLQTAAHGTGRAQQEPGRTPGRFASTLSLSGK